MHLVNSNWMRECDIVVVYTTTLASLASKIQMQFTRHLHASRIQKNIYNHMRYQWSSP
jgi:hypothetical protein